MTEQARGLGRFFHEVLRHFSPADRVAERAPVFDEDLLRRLDAVLAERGIRTEDFLAEAAVRAFRQRVGAPDRRVRDALEFLVANRRSGAALRYADGAPPLQPAVIASAVASCNRAIELTHDLAQANNVPIFELLGLRNLSSFIGEMFAREVLREMSDLLCSNPNQDGYPDLLALTDAGRAYITDCRAKGRVTAKEFWSPYPHGGIEVKATCGNTPSARVTAKPAIGESRLGTLVSAEWKAHHRETNRLLGVYWDFVDRLPTVLAVFFRNDLTENDWGKIIHPKEGGGRTTSVSIMVRGARLEAGVSRMGNGWLVLPADPLFRGPLTRVFFISNERLTNATSDPRITPGKSGPTLYSQ